MKKTVVVAVVVLGLCWAAASWMIGARAESLYRDWMALYQEMPAGESMRVEIIDYDRGIFSSHLRTCLHFDESVPILHTLSGMLCEQSRLYHGPLIWTSRGPWLGLAYLRGELDTRELSEETRVFLDDMSAGEPLLQGRAWLGSDRSLRSIVRVPPLYVESPQAQITLGQFEFSFSVPDMLGDVAEGEMELRDLLFSSDAGSFGVASIHSETTLSGLLDDVLPIFEMTFWADQIHFLEGPQAGRENDAVRFDLVVRLSTEGDGDTFSGESGVWVTELVNVGGIAADDAYIGVRVDGLRTEGIVRLQAVSADIDRARAKLLGAFEMFNYGAEGEPDLDDVMAELEELHQQRLRILIEDVLIPETSFVRLESTLKQSQDMLMHGSIKADYFGRDGSNLTGEQVDAMDAAGTLMDDVLAMLSVSFFASMRESMVDLVWPAQETPFLYREDGRAYLELLIDRGDVFLNDESRLLDEVIGMLMPEAYSDARADGDLDMTIMLECLEFDGDPDAFPDICYHYGLVPQ